MTISAPYPKSSTWPTPGHLEQSLEYVTDSAHLIAFLRNRAPSWIYTTGLTPANIAAALAAIQIGQTEPRRRDRLGQIYAPDKCPTLLE